MARGVRYTAKARRPDILDDDSPPTTSTHRPAPTFPEFDLKLPKPLTRPEISATNHYISFRNKCRSSPFYATLDTSSLTDEDGKVNSRKGFDPFNDQESYDAKVGQRRRTLPDFKAFSSSYHTNLQFFPKELWGVIDPKRRHPLWKIDPPKTGAGPGEARKRKRAVPAPAATKDAEDENADEGNSDEDSDAVVTGRRTHNTIKSRKLEKAAKQKQGLDAEDEYPEDQVDEGDEGQGGSGPEDSEFEEESDDADDDYNAEGYFETGEGDDLEEGAGEDDSY